MKELAQTPWANSFSFFCVDAEKRKGPLPVWLKKVPTLVINGEQQPRTDGDVMNWLSEMRLKNSGSGQRSGTGPGPAGSEPEPEGWNTMEHSSFARGFGYSFQDADTTTQGNGGSTIPGAFSFLNGNNGVGEKTSQDYNPGKSEQGRNKSKKEEMFDKQMEEYQRSRDAGMPQQRRVM